ncbi:hypothetical protein K431DRAFT_85998 [Polychaeton citri CBS 116435]|uniref:Uncharacterized protein n=1 Tax=Polychaeton citri CBS 116435 TaxID=1314669 RepID=A0A9P4Q9U7_9PEZI|nr:hypothetical protein K431DRAFT_85998 [Polychaeton citri CBS 116435]
MSPIILIPFTPSRFPILIPKQYQSCLLVGAEVWRRQHVGGSASALMAPQCRHAGRLLSNRCAFYSSLPRTHHTPRHMQSARRSARGKNLETNAMHVFPPPSWVARTHARMHSRHAAMHACMRACVSASIPRCTCVRACVPRPLHVASETCAACLRVRSVLSFICFFSAAAQITNLWQERVFGKLNRFPPRTHNLFCMRHVSVGPPVPVSTARQLFRLTSVLSVCPSSRDSASLKLRLDACMRRPRCSLSRCLPGKSCRYSLSTHLRMLSQETSREPEMGAV